MVVRLGWVVLGRVRPGGVVTVSVGTHYKRARRKFLNRHSLFFPGHAGGRLGATRGGAFLLRLPRTVSSPDGGQEACARDTALDLWSAGRPHRSLARNGRAPQAGLRRPLAG